MHLAVHLNFRYYSALYIVKSSLKTLGLRSLKAIRNANVAILENPNLCLAETINWNKIKKPDGTKLMNKNKPVRECGK